MKYFTVIIALFLFLFIQCKGFPQAAQAENQVTSIPENTNPVNSELPVSTFEEIWVYVVAGREAALTGNLPLTDIGYFGAEIDSYGKLTGVPRRSALNFRGRVHLVVSCNGRALSYFTLRQGSNERRELIADLISETRNYDGLQINFENIPQRSGDDYFTFLQELRAGLERNKLFTVALAARTRKVDNDVYDYAKILPTVDRILVMAYDEHWSTSAPGPIASMGWCSRVARYSLDTIGPEKLIMGLPFYGRSWGSITPNRAYIHSGIQDIIREQNITEIDRDNGIPNFKYNTELTVTVFYEDEYSLSTRLEMYKRMGVRSVGFWRLGQETLAFWQTIGIESRR